MKRSITAGMLACMAMVSVVLHAQDFASAGDRDMMGKGKMLSAKQLPGAYNMSRMVVRSLGKDTVIDQQQMKIFTDRYMMYVHPLTGDSLGEFGIGTYKVMPDKIVEYVFFRGSAGTVNDSFEVKISGRQDGFVQALLFKDEQSNPWTLFEEYKRAGGKKSSSIDGAWKQVSRYMQDKDGVKSSGEPVKQYKMYQSGHFAWASTGQDSATKKPVTYYGYGTFDMNGKNKLVETNTSSTFRTDLVGKPVTVNIKMLGADSYEQTIEWPGGWKQVEVYERLK